MLQQRSRVEAIAERVGPDSFSHPNFRAIFSALLRAGEETPLDEIAASLRVEDVMMIEDLMRDADGYVFPERTVEDSILLLHAREIENRMYEIQRLRPIADAVQQERLDAELLQLRDEMGRSGKGVAKTYRIPNRRVH